MYELIPVSLICVFIIPIIILKCGRRVHLWRAMPKDTPPTFIAAPFTAPTSGPIDTAEAALLAPSPLFQSYQDVQMGDKGPPAATQPAHEIKPDPQLLANPMCNEYKTLAYVDGGDLPEDKPTEKKPPEGRLASPLHPEYKTIGYADELPKDGPSTPVEIAPVEGRLASPFHNEYKTMAYVDGENPLDAK